MARVSPVNYTDFTGGLNLRADSQQLEMNESPWMLNVEIDPRGGFFTRSGFEDWEHSFDPNWDPRTFFVRTAPDGLEHRYLASAGGGGKLWHHDGGSFTALATVDPQGAPHAADFAEWGGDVFIACGKQSAACRHNENGTVTVLDDPADVGWNNDPLAPGVDKMPKAEFVASHMGYLWAANTLLGSDRVYVSFPNDPDSWNEDSYIPFPEGGGPITGLVPYQDHLLVFFTNSVWAIYGNTPESFQKAQVTETIGAPNRQMIARGPQSVYFVAWPEGVFEITGSSVREVSLRLRPAIESNSFGNSVQDQWLSWAGQRLWWTVPYNPDGVPSGPEGTFVMDPSLGTEGSWTFFKAGDGGAVGPCATSESERSALGCLSSENTILRLDGRDRQSSDLIAGVEYPFESAFRTPWIDAGWPTGKKRWRRPDFIIRENALSYSVSVLVYHDYDEIRARRTKVLSVGGGGDETVWVEDPDWDGTDASLETPEPGALVWSIDPAVAPTWGQAPDGSTIERLGSLGSARAVQLKVDAQAGTSWGVNAIIYKYTPRKFR